MGRGSRGEGRAASGIAEINAVWKFVLDFVI